MSVCCTYCGDITSKSTQVLPGILYQFRSHITTTLPPSLYSSFPPSLSLLWFQGLIFVVDCNDRERVGEAKAELDRLVRSVFVCLWASECVCVWVSMCATEYDQACSSSLFLFQLQEDELRDSVILVFAATSRTSPMSMNVSEVIDKLGLHQLRNKTVTVHEPTAVQSCCTVRNYCRYKWTAKLLDRCDGHFTTRTIIRDKQQQFIELIS